jgi:WD40 repeat protein/serine/threonine protein kinase
MAEILVTDLDIEQNLSLGILALNRDLISEESLRRALRTWTGDPGRALGEILIEQGDLSPHKVLELQSFSRDPDEEHGNDAPEAASGGASHSRFRIVRLLSQGGLGEIFVAHDQDLNRQVALKRIQTRHADHPECRIRFLREAEVAAALEHPGIVPVYAVGKGVGGQPFYAMRLIQGETLQEAIYRFHGSQHPLLDHDLEFRQLLGRFVAVCNAMAYAHSQRVIHRDLKPANIMLGGYGQTLILDWGLAKSLRCPEVGADDTLPAAALPTVPGVTQIGRVMGTPQFMSPEQAAGAADSLTYASDIYSLGATLYCLLTGREPFLGAAEDLIPNLVQSGDFLPPRRRRPDIPPALEAICLKAMERDPGRRYANAGDMAHDVERWLADEAVTAYAEPYGPRISRWARRHKSRVGLTAAALAVAATILIASSLLSAVSSQRLDEQRRADMLEEDRAQIASLAQIAMNEQARANRYLYFSRIDQADRAWQESQVERMLQLLKTAHDGPSDVLGFEWHYLWRLYNSSRFTLSAHRESITCVAYSPDGKYIATGSVDRVVRLWNASTGLRVRKFIGHAATVNAIVFSPDGSRLATASADGTIKLWEYVQSEQGDRGRCLGTLADHIGSVNTVSFSSDGRRLASAGDDRLIRIWDTASPNNSTAAKPVRVISTSFPRVVSVAFSLDSRLIAGCGKVQGTEGEIMAAAVWDQAAPEPIAKLSEHRGHVTCVAFSPDGRYLATASDDNTTKLWNVADLHNPGIFAVRTLKGHGDSVSSLAFSKDGRLATGSEDRTIKIWRLATGRDEMTIRGHTRPINGMAFSPDGRNVVSSSADNTIRVWDVTHPQEAQCLTGHTADVNSVAFSVNGEFLATGSDDESVCLWDVLTGNKVGEMAHALGGINSVAFSPDGRLLAGANQTGQVYVWDFAARKQLLILNAGDKNLWALRFSHDGKHLAVASGDGNTRVWNVESFFTGSPGRCLLLAGLDVGGLSALAFSPDGRHIATGAADGTLHIWDLQSGVEEWHDRRHEGNVYGIAYNLNGDQIATVSADCTVRLWDSAAHESHMVLRGHLQSVTAVAFSPDGRRLVTGGNDRVIKLWDVETGDEALTLKGHTDTVTCLAFSKDGRRLVSSSDDKTIRIWNATSLDLTP